MAEGVHADLAYAVLIADADEGAHEVARLDRPARPGCEDETGVSPGGAEVRTVGLLLCLPGSQGDAAQADQRKIPATGSCLDRADL